MYPHRLTTQSLFLYLLVVTPAINVIAQKQKPPSGGPLAVVVDERLAVLRATPGFGGKFVRRLPRGKLLAIGTAKNTDGSTFLLVSVSKRTRGWLQREAVVSARYPEDAQKLLTLIRGSADYERIVRSRIFLKMFPHSEFIPEILLLLGDAAESTAVRLTRDASRKLKDAHMLASEKSYYLNYSGLDRYSRKDVYFVFDDTEKRLHYDGRAWRDLTRRFPRSPQAAVARVRLDKVKAH